MSKFRSESFGLASKDQLKANRDHLWTTFLLDAGLDARKAAFWTLAEKTAEATAWHNADLMYEAQKASLKAQLLALAPSGLAVYFAEIGVAPQDVNLWLAASPAV